MDTNAINILNINKLTVLFFYSEASFLPEIKHTEKQVKAILPSIDVLKVNVKHNPKVSTSFHVDQTPVVLILENGKEIWRQASSFSENELQSYLTQMGI